mmetsp:Transcript_24714/g.58653  ORF Transcript_24714/g.58653 Transcript_24714/m.58653 type:complete len:201 (+) Transcript_24714:644-1246(+)
MLSTAPKFCIPSSFCSSVIAASLQTTFSLLKTTDSFESSSKHDNQPPLATPDPFVIFSPLTFASFFPINLSFCRTAVARGSREADRKSDIWILVGSALPPAPMHEMTRILFFAQYEIRLALVGTSSMASMRTSHSLPFGGSNMPPSLSGSPVYILATGSRISRLGSGQMSLRWLHKTVALESPTSLSLATACRFRLLKVT